MAIEVNAPPAPSPTDLTEPGKYWGFISYAHADGRLARQLHQSIESYRVPRALLGRATQAGKLPRRIRPIFRDTDELPASSNLREEILAALRHSRWLIVICSPAAARSEWVNREVEYFQSLGRARRILCVIAAGSPGSADPQSQCFPQALLSPTESCLARDAIDWRIDPLAADVRKGKDSLSDARLRLLAGIFGIGFDDLKRRELRRRRRSRSIMGSLGVALSVFVVTGYGLMADGGVRVPGNESLRALIDRHEWSVLRPIADDATVRAATQRSRNSLLEKLQLDRANGKFLFRNPAIGSPRSAGLPHIAAKDAAHGHDIATAPPAVPDAWLSAQAVTALFDTPEFGDSSAREYLSILDQCFAAPPLNRQYGWSPAGATYTEVEPALWMISAIDAALRRPGLIDDSGRPHWLARLRQSQSIADRYRNDDGSWEPVGGAVLPSNPSTYTAALALFALLETHAGDLPWGDDNGRRDALLTQTVAWLNSQYQSTLDTPGWQPTSASATNDSVDGLTLEIYYLLLRAHTQLHTPLPREIRAGMLKHLLSLEFRQASFPSVTIRPRFYFRDQNDQPNTAQVSIRCLWRPWALMLASQWLASGSSREAAPEDCTRVRRVRSYLIVGFPGSESRHQGTENVKKLNTYTAAENLLALSLANHPELSTDHP